MGLGLDDFYLVGGFNPTPLKNDGLRPLGCYSIPNMMGKVIQNSMLPVTTSQIMNYH